MDHPVGDGVAGVLVLAQLDGQFVPVGADVQELAQ